MTSTLLQFGAVILVVMIGFAMALHVLFRDVDTFGETFLGLFKAMLGETDFFNEFSGGRFDLAATILVVLYLFIVTIMLLNLLIAILSTAHAQVQENVEGEFKVSKARIVAYYRMVVDKNLLPAPFNLVQLVVSLVVTVLWCGCGCLRRVHGVNPAMDADGNPPGAAPDEEKTDEVEGQGQMGIYESATEGGEHRAGGDRFGERGRSEVAESTRTQRGSWRDAYKDTEQGFGLVVFWLVLGPVAVAGGALLWILSALPLFPYAQYAWYTSFKQRYAKMEAQQNKNEKRRSPVSRWGFVGWRWAGITVSSVTVTPVCLCVLWFLAATRVFPYGAEKANDGAGGLPKGESNPIIESILRKGPGGVGADKLRGFLQNPMNDKDARQDKKDRNTTVVEHIKLLQNRLEMTTKDALEELRNSVKSELREVMQCLEATKEELKRLGDHVASRRELTELFNSVASTSQVQEMRDRLEKIPAA